MLLSCAHKKIISCRNRFILLCAQVIITCSHKIINLFLQDNKIQDITLQDFRGSVMLPLVFDSNFLMNFHSQANLGTG